MGRHSESSSSCGCETFSNECDHGHEFSKMEKLKKYIKGDAPDGGSGTKSYPWNRLSQAEAANNNWDILIVLPSKKPVYGGLKLLNGQVIQGEGKREKCVLASLDDSEHNGDVIVAVGDNKIKGITISTAYRCAISCLESRNLTVEDCKITNSNSGNLWHPHDYRFGSRIYEFSYQAWGAIDFFGGEPQDEQVQAFNTINGKFKCKNCVFDGNIYAIIVGSGDAVSNSYVSERYHREYEITDCIFKNDRSFAFGQVMVYPQGGGISCGKIKRCKFDTLQNAAIAFGSIQGLSIFYPGRGNFEWKRNTVENCEFTNLDYQAVFVYDLGNQTGENAEIIVKNNKVSKYALNSSPNANVANYAAFECDSFWNAEGLPLNFIVKGNTVINESGTNAGTDFYFFGGHHINGEVKCNKFLGCSTGVDMVNIESVSNPVFNILTPGPIAGQYSAVPAQFGPTEYNINGPVVLADPLNANTPLVNAAQVNGKVVLVKRGGDTYVTKVRNCQNAGAIGVIIYDDSPNSYPRMEDDGTGSDITIPSVGINLADGELFFYNINGLTCSLEAAELISGGDIEIISNKFQDNDSVITVIGNSFFEDLQVKVQENCFRNTGARNSPSWEGNGSFYGGAILLGGPTNTYLSSIGFNADIGNVTFDAGGGVLGSVGQNSFINTSGPDTWVEAGHVMTCKLDWFDGDSPVDAGAGGTALFVPVLPHDPETCSAKCENPDCNKLCCDFRQMQDQKIKAMASPNYVCNKQEACMRLKNDKLYAKDRIRQLCHCV